MIEPNLTGREVTTNNNETDHTRND